MCKNRLYDVIAIIVSILVGIALTVLVALGLITSGLPASLFGVLLGAFSLFVLVLSATSLLRQDQGVNLCIHARGKWLLIPALWLVIVSALMMIFTLTNPIVLLILAFLLFTLISLTLFGLYSFLACLIRAGHDGCGHGQG